MSEDERAIRTLIERWMEASKTGDNQTVLSLMTDDVIFMVPGKAPFGKAEFAAMSEGMKTAQIDGTADVKELQVIGEWAWLRNYLTVSVTPPDGRTIRRSGYTLTVLRKGTDGRWQLARDANLLTAEGI